MKNMKTKKKKRSKTLDGLKYEVHEKKFQTAQFYMQIQNFYEESDF